LHISNVAPGKRVETVDEVLTAGDVIKVRVAELDRERGRIGLRLSDDPSVAGKTVEELKSLSSGNGSRGGGGGGGDRGSRGPRREGGERPPRRRREGDRDPDRRN
ncbi:MAG: polyribonucleotide nucleotidyltransferase, partial [Solirubrobacteraceae bacterium]